jgi:hypothetical protein
MEPLTLSEALHVYLAELNFWDERIIRNLLRSFHGIRKTQTIKQGCPNALPL